MIGVEPPDVLGEPQRLSSLGGVDLDPAPVPAWSRRTPSETIGVLIICALTNRHPCG